MYNSDQVNKEMNGLAYSPFETDLNPEGSSLRHLRGNREDQAGGER